MTTQAKWNTIEIFSLKSMTGNNNLYSNGRQSIPIRIAIQAIDINGSPVRLSETELGSLKLLNLHGGTAIAGPVEASSDPLNEEHGQWDWSYKTSPGFRFFPSPGRQSLVAAAEPGTSKSADTSYIEVYLRTTSSLRFTVMAQIRRDDGELFESGKLEQGSLLMDPVRPPTYRVSDYRFEEILIKENPLTYYYRFGLFAGGENIEFWRFDVNPNGLFGWTGKNFFSASITGYTSPGQSEIRYGHSPWSKLPTHLELPAEQGQAVIVWIALPINVGYDYSYSPGIGRKRTTKADVSAIDVYGNKHDMTLRFINGNNGGKIELI